MATTAQIWGVRGGCYNGCGGACSCAPESEVGVAVVLALASAVVYGAADFLGGLSSRRASAFGVVAVSQVVGLLALLALLPWLGGPVGPSDLAWGAAAGIAGAAGLVIFYRTLARGVMSVVAPVTAVTAAAVPVLVGLLIGNRIGLWAAAGIVLALAAVVLVSAEGGLSALRAARPASLAPALAAGAAFGLFFVLLDRTSQDSGLTPLVAARLASVALRGRGRPRRQAVVEGRPRGAAPRGALRRGRHDRQRAVPARHPAGRASWRSPASSRPSIRSARWSWPRCCSVSGSPRPSSPASATAVAAVALITLPA